ncbi:MAG: tRNA pseudouridine(13) synthase TruD [Nanoarchaeota archaeon]|nr:tRNA pseudouridine(13) synthase TruD [Nanoarchaeota archaeon]
MIGVIKEVPEDFVVEEVFEGKTYTVKHSLTNRFKDFFKKGRGSYVHFTLVKRNWTSAKSLKFIARRLGISFKRMGFAGNKDKRAVTAQRCSAKKVSVNDLKNIRLRDVILKDFEVKDEPIMIGGLDRNEFTITLRNCEHEGKDLKKKVDEFFEEAQKHGVPNLFGQQRFGGNEEVGMLIFKQDFEGAVKAILSKNDELKALADKNDWRQLIKKLHRRLDIELAITNHLVKHPNDYVNAIKKVPKRIFKLFVYAVQSKIFNQTVTEYFSKHGKLDENVQLVGYASKLSSNPVDKITKKILKETGLGLKDFRVKSFPEMSCKGTWRKALVFPTNYKFKKFGRDTITFKFALPKGCYATTILEAIE